MFPAYSQALVEEAKEQTLRTIVAHLIGDEDYRDLFTTAESFLTRRLGVVYRVPVPTAEGWEPYVFERESGREGLLTHISFNALYAHAGRSSATLRGKFVREVIRVLSVPYTLRLEGDIGYVPLQVFRNTSSGSMISSAISRRPRAPCTARSWPFPCAPP